MNREILGIMRSTAAEQGSRDHCAVLGGTGHATPEEIRAPFRRLAAEYQPDRNPNDTGAAVAFKRVNAAFQVLSDPAQREAYDRLTRPIDDDSPSRPRPAPNQVRWASRPEPKASAGREGVLYTCPRCVTKNDSRLVRCEKCLARLDGSPG